MSKERSTRSKPDVDRDELLIQKVVENLITSELFLNKLCEAVSNSVRREFEHIIHEHELKVVSLQNDLAEAKLKIEKLEERVEMEARVNNLRVYGVPETVGENTALLITDLCKNKLNIELSDGDIDYCYRMGKYDKSKTRVIVVKFVRRNIKSVIYSKKKNLKGTRIVLREDLTPNRLTIMKEAIDKYGYKNVWTSNGTVMVKQNKVIRKIYSVRDINVINER